MDELEKNMPDDFWRKAFDDAAETPPSRVWNAIERQLDESNKTKVLPLWGIALTSSRPMAWAIGIAATVTVLLIGWWSVGTRSTDQPSVATATARAAKSTLKSLPQVLETPNKATGHKSVERVSEAIASASKPSVPFAKSQNYVEAKTGSSLRLRSGNELVAQPALPNFSYTPGLEKLVVTAMTMQSQRSSAISVGHFSSATPIAMTSSAYTQAIASDVILSKSSALVAFNSLSSRSFHFRDLGQIHRIVWFQAAEPISQPEEIKSKQKSREVWASASVMPGTFNPMVAVKNASSIGTSSASLDALKGSTTSQQSVSSRANFSVAYQAGAGVQLSDRWSIESGVGYLAGRSTIETPTQLAVSSLLAMNGGNATASNLYVDALRNSIHQDGLAYSVPQANLANTGYVAVSNNYNSQTRQVLTNDYQYMQVPVQVGYQLRPKKRLSLALLGGLITNIFIRNTVDNEVVVTAKDGVYRPLSLAAVMGARFRYRPTRQWSASLAGMYQPSLGLGTQADSQVQTQPTTTGMSFGVDYHF